MNRVRNILLIKPGAIGDLLQISPVVRAIKNRYPQAQITLLVANTASIDLFRHNPYVNDLLVFDKRGLHRSWPAFMGLWLDIRRRRFDLVLNFQRSNLKAWLLALASFPCRVLVYHKARKRVVHAVENHLETVAPLGIDPQLADKRLELFVGPDDRQWGAELLNSEGLADKPLVALNLGASHPVNRWPVEHFASLAERLTRELGAAVLLVGGSDDRPLADGVLARLATPVVDLVGRTSLLQLGAVLERCNFMVSGDTGPMHLATAVDTKVIALFGAADPSRTGPVGEGHVVLTAKGLDCVPCRSRSCSHTSQLECMQRISVAEVMAAAVRILEAA